MTRGLAVFAAAAVLVACGGGGTMTGTVTVAGGDPANIAVFIYGPASTAAVTNAEGRFTATGLPDGNYSVVAKVRGAEVEEVAVPVEMVGGKPAAEPTLAFTLSSGTVTGTLVFADASDASNVSISLSGTTSRGARTGSGGTFTFEKVPTGAYVVSVDLADTREKRVSVAVAVAGASQDVGELRMTPVGRIGGSVTLDSAPASGVTVAIAGTALSALTDAMGHFDFLEVPTGDVTFAATTGPQGQYSGSVSAHVSRGTNADVTLALGDTPSRRGVVQGVVTFPGVQSPTIIAVSIPGTAATATPGSNGAFSMQVPEGDWDVVARAPFHPQQTIGRAHVVAGQTTLLPAMELSWYREILRTDGAVTSISPLGSSRTAPWLVFFAADSTGIRSFLFNTRTFDLRVLANAVVGAVLFTSNAKYVGFTLSGELFLYEIATGTLTDRGLEPGTWDVSTDETVLFAARGAGLERIVLATGATTRFPTTGDAAVLEHTRDRWLVRETSNEVTLVEPTQATASVFTQVQTLSVYPTPWALTTCGTSCTLKVLPPAGRSAQTVARAFAPTTGIVSGSPADFPSYFESGTYVIVQSSNGNHTVLPTGTNQLIFSPDAKRYAFRTSSGGTTTLREEALPPTVGPGTVGQSTYNFSTAYVSNSRLVGVETGGGRRIFDWKVSGTGTPSVSVETDVYTTSPPRLVAPLVLWGSPSASKWRAFVGDKATLTLDVPLSQSPISYGARPVVGAESPTDYATVSFDFASAFVLDEKLGQVRELLGGYGQAPDRSGTTEFFSWLRSGATDFVTFGPEVAMSKQAPGVLFTVDGSAAGERVVLAVPLDQHAVWFGAIRP